jgi:very-short-patch-repair endonuclease
MPLTRQHLIGIIRGLFCLLISKSFEELDGGQHTFRQKTCKTG